MKKWNDQTLKQKEDFKWKNNGKLFDTISKTNWMLFDELINNLLIQTTQSETCLILLVKCKQIFFETWK